MAFDYRLGGCARALDAAAMAYADDSSRLDALCEAAIKFATARRRWDRDHASQPKVRKGRCFICNTITESGVLGRPKKYCGIDCYKEGRRRAVKDA